VIGQDTVTLPPLLVMTGWAAAGNTKASGNTAANNRTECVVLDLTCGVAWPIHTNQSSIRRPLS
jgi:hypothetical protein